MTHRAAAVVPAVLALVLVLSACDGAPEPTRYTTIASADDYAATRSQADRVLADASAAALEALGGRAVDGATSLSPARCNEVSSSRFSTLEGGASFTAPDGELAASVRRVEAAWSRPGWDVEVAGLPDLPEPDSVLLTTETRTGVRVAVTATLERSDEDGGGLGVSLKASTRCLELPRSVGGGS